MEPSAPTSLYFDYTAFARYPWHDVIDRSKAKVCHEYARGFFAESKRLADTGDMVGAKVFNTLRDISLFSFRPNDRNENPYSALWSGTDGRSAAPEDFGTKALDLLRAIETGAKDPDFRGRVLDLMWVLGRDFRASKEAAECYNRAAAELAKTTDRDFFLPRLERAMQLGRRHGRDRAPFSDSVKLVEELLEQRKGTEAALGSCDLMKLLLNQRGGDPQKFAMHAALLAARIEGINPTLARNYWNVAQLFYREAGKGVDAKRAAVQAAETYVLEAGEALKRKRPSHMAAAGLLAAAIDALRKAGGPKQRISALRKRMLAEQRAGVKPESGEMGTMDHTIDLTKIVEKCRQQIRGKNLTEALLRLAELNPPVSRKQMEKQSRDHLKHAPVTMLIGTSKIDAQGRIIARKPGASPTNNDQLKEAIDGQMWIDAKICRTIRVNGTLVPAIQLIRQEHDPRFLDLKFLVLNNPCVPPGREDLIARGLLAGLRWDWSEAGHFLIPQIENILRHVLECRGVIASGLDKDLLQSNYGLKKLLAEMPQSVATFGADLVFDLRGLLIEKLGSNLRNEFAHGLMDVDDFYSESVIYLWGLCLRMMALPILAFRDAEKAREAEKKKKNPEK